MEQNINVRLGSKGLIAFQTAQCQCNLSFSTREARNLETERIAKEYITNLTAFQTTYLLTVTIPPFNLTSQMGKETVNQAIPDFVLRGSLYGITLKNFAQGYNGTNDTKLWSIHNNCNTTSCYPAWVSLADYVKNEYIRSVLLSVGGIASTAKYPLGRYRPWSARSYNYSSYDFAQQPPLACSCTVIDGYSYRVRFSINATYLKPNHYDANGVTGMLTLTDLELAIDKWCSSTFGESYIQSSFERWEPPINGSTFYVMIYFKGIAEADCNNSLTNTNSNMSAISFLLLRYLKLVLTITSPPVATECYRLSSTQFVPTTTQTVTSWMPTSTSAGTFEGISSTSTSTFEETYSTSASTFEETYSTSASTFEETYSTSASTFEETYSTSASTFEEISTSLPSTTSAATSFSSTERTSTTNGSTQQYPVSTTPATMSLTQTLSVTTSLNDTQSLPTTAGTMTALNHSSTSVTLLGTTSQTVQSDVNAFSTATKTTPSSANSINGTETLSNLIGSTQMNAITSRKASNTSATPFDKDPFFKAEVPVITKIYNDRYLLKGIGATARSVVENTFFYQIAIPAAAGMLVAIVLCLVLCQIDWIALIPSSKNAIQ